MTANTPTQSIDSTQNKAERSSKDLFKNLVVLKKIKEEKFTTYLTALQSTQKRYVMKVFPYSQSGQPSRLFINEARFADLQHKYVIAPAHYETKVKIETRGKRRNASYILTEYAPHGDFFDFLSYHSDLFNDIIIRTYFHHLIEGLEFLHSKGISHLDLKMENLLIGEDFRLKIMDFDMSHMEGDSNILTAGTVYYRAPELADRTIQDTKAADIFSAGIILFIWKSKGRYPQTENVDFGGVNLYNLSQQDNRAFWTKHSELQKEGPGYFDGDFKELYNSMTKLNPQERASIEDIKKSSWYNGPVLSDETLKAYMESRLSLDD